MVEDPKVFVKEKHFRQLGSAYHTFGIEIRPIRAHLRRAKRVWKFPEDAAACLPPSSSWTCASP
ncbi:hypothetical protein DY000_02022074 [Brassica cretica]|uniref:Uncharacterized protein n=1 Tax=Brassica cretica TaxID=69181 RepID=A0ABQ7E780_BRACR|nr:hypothetical protein DY000_02022074 [Brassica cretica]